MGYKSKNPSVYCLSLIFPPLRGPQAHPSCCRERIPIPGAGGTPNLPKISPKSQAQHGTVPPRGRIPVGWAPQMCCPRVPSFPREFSDSPSALVPCQPPNPFEGETLRGPQRSSIWRRNPKSCASGPPLRDGGHQGTSGDSRGQSPLLPAPWHSPSQENVAKNIFARRGCQGKDKGRKLLGCMK